MIVDAMFGDVCVFGCFFEMKIMKRKRSSDGFILFEVAQTDARARGPMAKWFWLLDPFFSFQDKRPGGYPSPTRPLSLDYRQALISIETLTKRRCQKAPYIAQVIRNRLKRSSLVTGNTDSDTTP